jgi:hypothetical protein
MSMNALGWAFLITAWTFVTALTIWCFWKVAKAGASYDDK